jgi:hypothetical protein
MMKIAVNRCYGGFGLSNIAIELYAKKKYGKKVCFYTDEIIHGVYRKVDRDSDVDLLFPLLKDCGDTIKQDELSAQLRSENWIDDDSIERNDPFLIETIEELGTKASGKYAYIVIVEIPDDVDWEIVEYDGHEHVAEVHRTW